ncbi:tail fiber domain-containing protein [Algicola sagamiensis]|uniref:tail fiber domain-containing protein n=1 Tax=Algicola sagamiensis TaxID=163869 RepID=UPI00035CA228|nr:tail fiber domain-containing protein [Algicola sagamiensis]
MKLPSLFLALFTSLAFIPQAHSVASTLNVYCGKIDGSHWYWLFDGNNNHITVTGTWHTDKVSAFAEKQYLNIEIDEYISFQNQCRAGYYAQAARHSLSPWYRFRVNLTQSVNGDFFYAPGRESLLFPFNPSDMYLKQDITRLNNSLDKASRIYGYSYKWRPETINGQQSNRTEYGVIAQEVQVEFPELVIEDQNGILQVDYRGLVPVLLDSVKELKERLENLERQH